jgi:hypothetical protein
MKPIFEFVLVPWVFVVVMAAGVATWREKIKRSQRERERGRSVLSWEDELGVLSFIYKICVTNEYMPRVLF